MKNARRAVIDVGTNSIKLLVADVMGREVKPVWEDSKQTRLGSGFYETHRLQPEAIARTAQAVALFAAKAREEKADSLRVIATSAARDAVNPGELTSAIEQASGLKVSGLSPVEHLCEMIELPEHPWFIACQFHPEFSSTPREGHPLFKSFIRAALSRLEGRRNVTVGARNPLENIV